MRFRGWPGLFARRSVSLIIHFARNMLRPEVSTHFVALHLLKASPEHERHEALTPKPFG